jgi:thiosulfate reductase/polysulfide reductase chain A
MSMKISRRKFLKAAGAAGALAAASGPLLVPTSKATAATVGVVPRLVPTICGMCEAHCGVLAYTQGDELLKLEGNFRHSHSLGKICPRGAAGGYLLDDANRLKTPLKRVGTRFEPISWEVAFSEIGASLLNVKQRLGAEGVAWLRQPDLSDAWDVQFMRALGSPNIFASTSTTRACRDAAFASTLGGVPVFDLPNARYVLLFDRNLAESTFPADVNGLSEAKAHGARIVVVDPRLTNTAALANEWVPIRPGSDGALLLALMNVLVAEGRYDAAFVAKYTVGFPALADYLRDKTSDWAAQLTDIPADTIIRLARELAAQMPACIVDPSSGAVPERSPGELWRPGWTGLPAQAQAGGASLCRPAAGVR